MQDDIPEQQSVEQQLERAPPGARGKLNVNQGDSKRPMIN